jgi:hypothetical protein
VKRAGVLALGGVGGIEDDAELLVLVVHLLRHAGVVLLQVLLGGLDRAHAKLVHVFQDLLHLRDGDDTDDVHLTAHR